MDLNLEGRVFILTGASRGLGLATAKVLVDEGARVLLCARDPERLDRAVAQLGDAASGVSADLPGRFDTERVAELEAAASARDGRSLDTVRADAEARIPLRRLGDPAELGRVAAFLLSPAASYVSGAAWRVDGGTVRGL